MTRIVTDGQVSDCMRSIHLAICGNHPRISSCYGPKAVATKRVLEFLDASPTDSDMARLVLHDLLCIYSYRCQDRERHAEQHAATIAAIRKWRSEEGLREK